MVERFNNFIRENNLINPNSTILLSVSGGVDSMVMADLFKTCGYKFAIAHCNFHLRGEESDQDALFVSEYAEKHKVVCHLTEFETRKFAERQKISIQMAARELRMKWFEGLVSGNYYQFYATAHHQDDQIETFLINLIRGCGISGLHGIKLQNGRLIHPMLFTDKQEIIDYALQNKIPFREDRSNFSSDYLRNRVRHILIPALIEIEPNYKRVFLENFIHFRQAESIYKQQIDSIISSLVDKNWDQVRISINQLKNLKPLETYLYEIISPYGFKFAAVNSIISTLSKQAGKLFLSDSHRLIKDREFLIIEKRIGIHNEVNEIQIDQRIRTLKEPLKLEFVYYKAVKNVQYKLDKNLAYLDHDKLTYPLVLRKWEKGDYFYPLGMTGKKRISDFFVDNKFSISEKENVWLLLSGNEIVWIIGHRIDNRYRITFETKNIVRIKYLF